MIKFCPTCELEVIEVTEGKHSGQMYCEECDKHFAPEDVLDESELDEDEEDDEEFESEDKEKDEDEEEDDDEEKAE